MTVTGPATAGEPTEAPNDVGRREALKKFGRVVAAGTSAVLLLCPRTGPAQQIPAQQIKLLVFRNYAPDPNDMVQQQQFHEERRRLLNGLIDSLDLQVIGGIYDVHQDGSPREVAEVIIAIGLAIGYSGVFPAMVAAFEVWLDRDKIKEVQIEGPAGTVVLKKGTPADVDAIARALGVTFPPG